MNILLTDLNNIDQAFAIIASMYLILYLYISYYLSIDFVYIAEPTFLLWSSSDSSIILSVYSFLFSSRMTSTNLRFEKFVIIEFIFLRLYLYIGYYHGIDFICISEPTFLLWYSNSSIILSIYSFLFASSLLFSGPLLLVRAIHKIIMLTPELLLLKCKTIFFYWFSSVKYIWYFDNRLWVWRSS